jgi:catechol 2,3-dioxygenase-like lactoylglutathione lyase family enzyme
MAIVGVSVVSVPVSDQEQAKKFYVERLGFELIRDDDPVPGIHWVQVAPRRWHLADAGDLVRFDAARIAAGAGADL